MVFPRAILRYGPEAVWERFNLVLNNFMGFFLSHDAYPATGTDQAAWNGLTKAAFKSMTDSLIIRFMPGEGMRVFSEDRVYKKALWLPNIQITPPVIVRGLFPILQIQSSLFVGDLDHCLHLLGQGSLIGNDSPCRRKEYRAWNWIDHRAK